MYASRIKKKKRAAKEEAGKKSTANGEFQGHKKGGLGFRDQKTNKAQGAERHQEPLNEGKGMLGRPTSKLACPLRRCEAGGRNHANQLKGK